MVMRPFTGRSQATYCYGIEKQGSLIRRSPLLFFPRHLFCSNKQRATPFISLCLHRGSNPPLGASRHEGLIGILMSHLYSSPHAWVPVIILTSNFRF